MTVPATPTARGEARPAPWWAEVTPDGWLLFATFGVRMLAYGALSVMLALYLVALGLDEFQVGAIFTVALAGGAAMTALLAAVADQLGRRRVLVLGSLLMAVAGVAFALTDNPLLLGVAAVAGTISPSGKEVGPFLSLEQAVLPQTLPDRHRTSAFAAFNMVGSLAGAVGSLAIAVPPLLNLGLLDGYRAIVWAYVALALLLAALFARLSPAAEARTGGGMRTPGRLGLGQSRGVVVRLSALFALDAFAGGFLVQGLAAYWFALRFQADDTALGLIFFGTNVAAALSFLAAPAIARRIGLLNAMVYTHLLSNVLLLFVPLMPTLDLAVLAWVVRSLFSQIDVPSRQSYTMAIIPPGERAAAAGMLSVARSAGTACAPGFTGAVLAQPALGLPFVVAGALKIVYDLAILAAFRGVKPPEELGQAGEPPRGRSSRA